MKTQIASLNNQISTIQRGLIESLEKNTRIENELNNVCTFIL